MFFSDLTGVNPSHRFEKACVKITKLHRRKGRFIKAVTETGGKIYAGKGRSWVCARVPLPGYSSFTGTSTYRDSRCRTRCLAEPACKSYAYHYLNAHDVNAFKCTLCLNKLTETRPSTIFPSRRETTLYQFGYNLAALTPEDIIRSGYWRNRGKANIAYTVGRHNSEMLSAAFQEGTTTVEEYSNAVEASVGIEWKVFSAGGKYERTWGTSTAEMDSATREFAQTRGETYEHTCDFSCSGTVYQVGCVTALRLPSNRSSYSMSSRCIQHLSSLARSIFRPVSSIAAKTTIPPSVFQACAKTRNGKQ